MPYRNAKPALTDRERQGCIYIQKNFSILNDYYTRNHRDINSGATELGHKYLEFYPIADPATAANEFVLYGRTGVYGNTNPIELCVRRPNSGDINEFTSCQTGSEGWYQLPSGILVKWKWNLSIGAGSAGVQAFTWNNAANYPAFSAAYQGFAWVSSDAVGTDPDVMVYESQVTNTQIQWVGWNRDQNTGAPNVTKAYKVNLIAIGKGPGV